MQTQTQTMVTVSYMLSQAGQKAAILAGRPGASRVTETLPLDDPEIMHALEIRSDGTLVLDTTAITLDSPPSSVSALACQYADVISAARARKQERDAEAAAREAARQAERQAAIERDRPAVEALLTGIEAADPLSDLPAGIVINTHAWPTQMSHDGIQYALDDEAEARADAIQRRRNDAATAKKDAERAARQAELDASRKAKGGYFFAVEGGMCSFDGQGLWLSGQSKRWVGVFSDPKGIDRFVAGPRGEHCWDVRSLAINDLLQGGGFDTSSRGRRRNESEFFGRVVSASDAEIVLEMHDSRSSAIKAARQAAIT